MTLTASARAKVSRRSMLRIGGAAALLSSAGLAGCGQTPEGPGLRGLAATTGMVADAVRNVVGPLMAASPDGFYLNGLMGPGVDPHSYSETRADVETLLQADAVFWNGLYLEAQLEELLLKLGAEKRVVAVAEAVPVDLRRANEDYEDRFDPHVWMDPKLWVYAVDAAAWGLAALSPTDSDAFAANASRYKAEMEALDDYSREVLGSVPPDQRVLLTAHDAFGYFGDAYGFDVVGVQGVSTESEAGVARIRELVDLIVERGVSAVFVESSVSGRNVEALIEGAAARGAQVAVGAELFSDAMGASGAYEGTYLGMIDHNVTAISRALGGDAPERGRIGRLGESA